MHPVCPYDSPQNVQKQITKSTNFQSIWGFLYYIIEPNIKHTASKLSNNSILF